MYADSSCRDSGLQGHVRTQTKREIQSASSMSHEGSEGQGSRRPLRKGPTRVARLGQVRGRDSPRGARESPSHGPDLSRIPAPSEQGTGPRQHRRASRRDLVRGSTRIPAVVFVDTSAWYALVDEGDPHHSDAAALARLMGRDRRSWLVTTDYVLAETHTLLRVRLGVSAVRRFLDLLARTRRTRLVWVVESSMHRPFGCFFDMTTNVGASQIARASRS